MEILKIKGLQKRIKITGACNDIYQNWNAFCPDKIGFS